MKKIKLTGVCVLLSMLLLTGCGQKASAERFLTVKDGKIINGRNEEVLLRGVNLGGWLIQESWMCPVNGEDRKWANLDTLELLESRFDEQQVQELIDTYQDNWITENDIKQIAELGCNVVRVPFWYRNFMKDEQGTWIHENPDENPGFKRLDWIIEQAEKYDMYVILDMHGCPGGQSMDHCCGTLGQNRLYTDEQCLDTMEKLWTAIAERYRGNAAVAAYDIMNEPQNNGGYEGENSYDPWESQSWELSNAVYDRMIQAVREADAEHIITVEGIWRLSNLPEPQEMGWTNMMYQLHLYDDEYGFRMWAEDLAAVSEQYGVAAYVGEFQNMQGLRICNENGINWTTWTYKGTNNDIGSFFWYYGEPDRADCANDSYETLLEKWGEPIRTEHFTEKEYITELITIHTADE
ncbi:MAG: cellulase family glycosylhydrolase [Lachnospiraceae bacterium]|nr:cellulase family glycosylhydrolase [Lachnospiraceae bacterium]